VINVFTDGGASDAEIPAEVSLSNDRWTAAAVGDFARDALIFRYSGGGSISMNFVSGTWETLWRESGHSSTDISFKGSFHC
jgi:hypothetical protein